MSLTRIRFQEQVGLDQQRRIVVRPEFPENLPDQHLPQVIDCDPAVAPFADLRHVAPGDHTPLADGLVRTVGERIYAALATHPGVHAALTLALNAQPGTTHQIHLLTGLGDAEGLPWETMHHGPAHFLGLDERWPLARIVAGPPTMKLGRFLEPPLRMVAVIAAADRDGIGEWEAIRRSVVDSGLDVSLVVFLADDALRDHIATSAVPRCETRFVPDSADGLIAEIERCRPQVLHIYAHGSSQFAGYLEIDTRGHRTLGQPQVFLTAQGLERLRDQLLLITLNACEGAAPSSDIRSLAYALVSKGVPAVVGMREAIDARDANIFCEAFYGAAFLALAGSIAPRARVRVDWAAPLQVARRALCKRLAGPPSITAAQQKSWTLPVLYRIPQDLWVRVADHTLALSISDQASVAAEIENLRAIRDGLPASTPQPSLDLFDSEIASREARFA